MWSDEIRSGAPSGPQTPATPPPSQQAYSFQQALPEAVQPRYKALYPPRPPVAVAAQPEDAARNTRLMILQSWQHAQASAVQAWQAVTAPLLPAFHLLNTPDFGPDADPHNFAAVRRQYRAALHDDVNSCAVSDDDASAMDTDSDFGSEAPDTSGSPSAA